MQQYVHFPVQVMMSMPIPYGMMPVNTSVSGSPQAQIKGSLNSSPQPRVQNTPGGDLLTSHISSSAQKAQKNKCTSPNSKKKDSSIEIIESPPSPFSCSQERSGDRKKQEGGGKSKKSKKAAKKLENKRDHKKCTASEDPLSSTSLGKKIKSKQDTELKSQGKALQAASTPQRRVTRHSSAASSRSPDQEHKLHFMTVAADSHHRGSPNQQQQQQLLTSHQANQKGQNKLNPHSLCQQPQEVIIDSDNTNSTEINECILIEDSVEEITNIKFGKKACKKKRSSDKSEELNGQGDISQQDQNTNYQIQKQQQHQHQQQEQQIQINQVNQDKSNNNTNNPTYSNFINNNNNNFNTTTTTTTTTTNNNPQGAVFYSPLLPNQYYYPFYNCFTPNGFYQNASQGSQMQCSPLTNQQQSNLQDQNKTLENQLNNTPQQQQQQKLTQNTRSQQHAAVTIAGGLEIAAASVARTKQSNPTEGNNLRTSNSGNKSSKSPEQRKVTTSPPSHCMESESEENNGHHNHKPNSSSIRISSRMCTRNSNQDVGLEDTGKRTRKHNSFYNNEDFISGEYMFVGKKLTSKRPNPIQYNPILKKKNQRGSQEKISSQKSLQNSLMEILSLAEKPSNSKAKNSFFSSVKPSEISRANKQAAKQAFTLPLSKRRPQRKLSDDVHKGSAFFFEDPKQKFIEETFEEDTILLVNNSNQNVEVKVKRTPLDKSAGLALKKNKDGQIVDPLAKISNRFDECSRNKYFSQINFIKDYKSGYAPIEIQNQQEKELDEMQKNEQQTDETHKQHFIRRKQTNNINLKRSCGVSYVKQPESKQENVSQIYERLPQLVFQCSNGQPKLVEHEFFYDKLYQKIFTSSTQWLLCTYFESEDESLMRDYLLYPEKRWELCKGKYFIVRNVNDIWPLFIEKQFLCFHFFFDHKELIKCPQMKDFSFEEVQNVIKFSNIQLGLLFKKSINGKKAFKKSLGEAFLGEIENHPSSKEPQGAKKKGRKSKNANQEEINKKEEDDQGKKNTTNSSTNDESAPPPLNMNKTQINKFFKEVKNKLKQDKFLNELPIFKKKIEDIQKYLLPYMKKLKSQETVMPSQEVIKSINELETNEEKVEALLEMMEFIQETINDEDYSVNEPQKEIRQRVSTRKDSLKKSTTNTPSLVPQAVEQNNVVFTQLLLNNEVKPNTNENQSSKNSSEIEIEIVDSDSKIQQNSQIQQSQPENKLNDTIAVVVEAQENIIEIEKQPDEQLEKKNEIIPDEEKKEEENELKEEEVIEMVEEKLEEEKPLTEDIEVKEEKIEVEESPKKESITVSEEKDEKQSNEIIRIEEQEENKKDIEIENNVQCNEKKSDEASKQIQEEKIEIEKEIDSESSSMNSPKAHTALQEIENMQQNYSELNQNAQNFEKLDNIHNEDQKVNLNSPIHESRSQTSSNKFLNSPSQTISKEVTCIEKPPNHSDTTTIAIEENTVPIPNQAKEQTTNETENKMDEESIEKQKEIRKESLICQEILNYIDKDISSKNINTLSAKLELYVEEKGWKSSSQLVKSLLSTFILYAKDQFEKLALEMMNIRFGIVRDENEDQLVETLKNIRFITKNSTKRRQTYENYAYLTRGRWDFHENHLQQNNIENNLFSKKEIKVNEEKLKNETEPITIAKLIDKEEGYSILKRGDLSMPLYYISTRDSFAFDLIEKITTCHFNGKTFTKTEFFFDPENHPTNFKSFVDTFPDYRVGATLYTGFFTHEELLSIEDSCHETEIKSFQRHYFPMTAQMTCTAQKIRRTKFFFGSRYIWTRQQLAEPHSFVGAGVRQDVSQPPAWMRRKVVSPLEQAGILPNGFINSLALNVYHDGKEGLAQHFDDATRFRQPIFTFKLFSDARLSFGSQLYGFCNSAFVIPMPRGSVLKLEENSYAANGIKHCVRPCDMAGKNATIIMRQMHHKVVSEAIIYDENVDLPAWISTLSSKEDGIPYGDQKEIEAEYLMRNSGQGCS